MKKICFLIILSISIFLIFSSCSCDIPTLTLTRVEWYTTTEVINGLTFGFVNLGLSGATNGNRVTVTTYGDGVVLEQDIPLTKDNKFNQNIIIQFTHIADDEPRTYSTTITAYRGNCQNQMYLVSEELIYLSKRLEKH